VVPINKGFLIIIIIIIIIIVMVLDDGINNEKFSFSKYYIQYNKRFEILHSPNLNVRYSQMNVINIYHTVVSYSRMTNGDCIIL